MAPIKLVREACLTSIKGFLSARSRKQQHEQRHEKKMQAQQLAEQRKKAAESKGSIAKQKGASKHAVFDLELAAHDSILEVAQDTDNATGASSTPVVFRASDVVKALADKNPCRLNMLVFKAGLMQQSGVDFEARVLRNATEVREALLTFCGDRATILMEGNDVLSQVYMTGVKRGHESVATELRSIATVRAMMSPATSTLMIMAPFAELAKHVASSFGMSDAAGVTLREIRRFFMELSQAELDTMATQCRLHHSVLQANDVIVIPAGYVVAEKATGIVSLGVRINFVQPDPVGMASLAQLIALVNDKALPSSAQEAIDLMKHAVEAMKENNVLPLEAGARNIPSPLTPARLGALQASAAASSGEIPPMEEGAILSRGDEAAEAAKAGQAAAATEAGADAATEAIVKTDAAADAAGAGQEDAAAEGATERVDIEAAAGAEAAA